MKHRLLFFVMVVGTALLWREAAFAQAITGIVTNGTTGKPAAGIEVALIDPVQGMAELTKATTDQQGKFSLQAGVAQGPRLVRAARDGVNYFRMAPPGTNNVAIDVYDAAKKLDRIDGTADVIRIQADGPTLQVVELFAVQNTSSPPRTLTADAGFEVAIPEGAKIDGADAQGPNGQPISISPQALKQKGHYSFSYPLKPGETRFQLAYELPYSGEAAFSPTPLRSWNHVVVVLPPSITWKPKNAALFQQMGNQPADGGNVQVASSVKPGQDLSFRISGTGTFPNPEEAAQSGSAQSGPPSARDSRPGGGLGPPIDAPDALAKYRWLILGVLAVVLAGGAYISVTRGPKPSGSIEPEAVRLAPLPQPQGAAQTAAAGSGNALLDAMKDELFQLEIERQQGIITPEDYEKQKTALDQTLKRALERKRRG
jgi:hypothetical protein